MGGVGPFVFTISGVSGTTSVLGGQCSGPMNVPSGWHTIVETVANLPAGDVVTGIPVSPTARKVGQTLSARRVTVKVLAGTTATNETRVTYINKVPPASLKICKTSANPTLQGSLFSFTENGGPAFSLAAGTPSSPICSSVSKWQVGTQVNLAELPTINVHTASISSTSAGSLSNVDLGAGTATVTLPPGTTVVTYDNEPNPSPQNGFIEVCKDASDGYVSGSFTFSLSGPGYSGSTTVPVGLCSGPMSVPAGNYTVTEAAQFPYLMDHASTYPASALVSQNRVNQTAVVSVPVSSSTNNETQVHFVNDTRMAQLKVCKALTANSGALAGQTFWFNITESFASTTGGTETVQTPVTAGAAGGSPLCAIVGNLPLGTNVTVNEVIPPGADFMPVSGDGSTLTITSGVNVATVTNEAMGTIEVCKALTGTATPNPSVSFPFTITDNGVTIPLSVPAGRCSLPQTVPAGTATVTEGSVPDYHFVWATGNGNTLVSVNGTSATYNVAAGGVANETVATFINAVNRAQFKICKVASDSILDGKTFTFDYSVTVNGTTSTGQVKLMPGECSALSPAIPVINADGSHVIVNVTEESVSYATVQSIVVDGSGTAIGTNTTTGTSCFTLGDTDGGITTDTYTNQPQLAG